MIDANIIFSALIAKGGTFKVFLINKRMYLHYYVILLLYYDKDRKIFRGS